MPGHILVERYVRTHPLFNEAELIQAHPQYVHVCFQDGRELPVPLCHLAPVGAVESNESGNESLWVNETELPKGGPLP